MHAPCGTSERWRKPTLLGPQQALDAQRIA
jgi:hypothetical protein